FRNREFTMYAVPVVVAIEAALGELDRKRVGEWLIALVVFFAVWEVVEALKPYADLEGPGTRGRLIGGFSGSQIENLVDRFNFRPGALVERIGRMGPTLVAWFAGATQVDTSLPLPNRPWLAWLAGLSALAAAGRLMGLAAAPANRSGRSWPRAIRDQLARAPF